jgi:hypothetical protein
MNLLVPQNSGNMPVLNILLSGLGQQGVLGLAVI